MEKTIGILGGMGPMATIDLFQKIVTNTPARIDQDHIKLFIYNNPKIPPRIFHSIEASNPLPELIRSAKAIEKAGSDFIIMPCHTAHIWYEDVKNSISIPFYSLVHETVNAIRRDYFNVGNKRVLLLATSHTVAANLYQKEFFDTDFELVVPNKPEQLIVDQTIESVKEGKINMKKLTELNSVINSYYDQGVSLLMGCCTEIPLMYHFFTTDMKMIDPTLILAKFSINQVLEHSN